MKRVITLITLIGLFTSASYASEKSFLRIGNDDYKVNQSNWIFNISLDAMEYPLTLPKYDGTFFQESGKEDNLINTGLGLGIGGEVHLFAGLSSTLKVGGFYHLVSDKTIGKAAKNVDIDLANLSYSNNVYGGEVSISLNYLFEATRDLNVQPFIEVSKGSGNGHFESRYSFESRLNQSENENYEVELDDRFDYERAALGINFIDNYGVSSYIKVSQTQLNITERNIKGSSKLSNTVNNTFDTTINRPEILKVVQLSLGLGILF